MESHLPIHTDTVRSTQTHSRTDTQLHKHRYILIQKIHPLHTLAVPHVHSFKTKLQKLSLVLREPAGALSTSAALQAPLNLPLRIPAGPSATP